MNIAEILKDCPSGMELDCTIVDGLYFDKVTENNEIKCYSKRFYESTSTCNSICFYSDGSYLNHTKAKCVIFPKGKTTWEGFHSPFKDGDILATDLGSVFFLKTRLNTDKRYGCYVGIGGDGSFHICEPFAYKEYCGLATEEEKEKLFQAIKANGYKWNEETKALEKLIEPKFKVGNIIQDKNGYKVRITDVDIEEEYYVYESLTINGIGGISFNRQDEWELAPNKFDINTLKPFDKVLVRCGNNCSWNIQLFSNYRPNSIVPFICMEHSWSQCIPFEGNEHLLGTTNDCEDFYKTW